MDLVRAFERSPPSWRTAAGARLLENSRATTPLASPSLSSSQQHISVQRAPLQDLFSFASSVPINSRTSVEAMLQGTRLRMLEMRLKMQHRFPRRQTQEKSLDHAGLIGLTAATDLNRRHRLTFESTLGSDEDRQSMSTFVSSKFESRISWGLAISHKVHRTLTFFSRYNSDDYARNQFILQVVHKLNEKATLSPIFSVSTGCHPQAGFSLTRQLTQMSLPHFDRHYEDVRKIFQERLQHNLYSKLGIFGNNSLQVKGFFSGGGAYSLSIKVQAGQVD